MLFAGILLAVIFVAIKLYGHQGFSADKKPTITWVKIQHEPLESHLGILGYIDTALLTAISVPFDGILTELSVREGGYVNQGQPIASVDTGALDIEIRDALANQLRAQRAVLEMRNWDRSLEVTRARRTLSNVNIGLQDAFARLQETRRLYEQGIIARAEVDALEKLIMTQKNELASARDELDSTLSRGKGDGLIIPEMEYQNAKARHEALLNLKSQSTIVAPFAGIILPPATIEGQAAQKIHTGMKVSQGTQIFTLANLERVHAVGRIAESDLHSIKVGMPAVVTGEGFHGKVLKGTIVAVGAKGTPSTSGGGISFDILVEIEPLNQEMQQYVRLGMTANIVIVTYNNDHGIVVPPNALYKEESGALTILYRKTLKDLPEEHRVKIGRAFPQGIEVFGTDPGYVAVKMLPR